MGERALAIARKETRLLLRDPVYLGLAFAVPLLFIIVLGYQLSLDVKGLRFVAGLLGDGALARAADRKAAEVLGLHAGGPFACLQPVGSRRIVRTVLDFVYVGLSMTQDLPPAVRRGFSSR